MPQVNEQTEQLRRMKRLALSLLLGAAGLYVLARALQGVHPGFAYLAAFAEAAMVGAIADWFAVVALFRHPLGLPIPHTAIIPQSKQRIGENLAAFICQHFLSNEQVLGRVREFDPAAKLAGWLAQPRQAEWLGRLFADAMRYSLSALEDSRVQHFIHSTALARLEQLDFAKLSGQVMAMLTSERRHQALLDELLQLLDDTLAAPEVQARLAEAIAGELRNLEYLGWTMKRLGVDEWGGEFSTLKLVKGLSGLLDEVAHDPQHPLRQRFDNYVAELVERLQHDPALRLKGEQIKTQLLAHPQLSAAVGQLWRDTLDWLRDDLGREDSSIRAKVSGAALLLGEKLQRDAAMQSWINEQLLAAAPQWIARYREDIRRHIASRVDAWGTEELVSELETNLGRDLQFIRINGTLVGGTVGLLIYTLTQWLG